MSGRDLPAAGALSGHANVLARADAYEASGAFPGRSGSSLQALAYLDLLNGVSAQDRVAFARADAADPPPDADPPTARQPDGDQPPDDDPGRETARAARTSPGRIVAAQAAILVPKITAQATAFPVPTTLASPTPRIRAQ